MIVLLVMISFILIICFVGFIFSWSVHISRNKDTGRPYDWCTFDTFIKEFNKYINNPNLEIRANSIFLYKSYLECDVYLHASIIKFDEKCMILYPLSWIKYCIWKNSFTKYYNRCKGLWK